MYPRDALARARQRGWVEFGTATLADAWQFLNATDRPTADAKQAAFRHRLQQLEVALGSGPYFNGATFGMVDAVFAPIFRYFDILDPAVSDPHLGEPATRVGLAERARAAPQRDRCRGERLCAAFQNQSS